MNKKTKLILVGAIVVITLVIGYFVFIGKVPKFEPTGTSINGRYNSQTGECEPSPGSTAMFGTCCFNQGGQQVDCNDASRLLGASPLAIYQGTSGIDSIQHFVQLVNTGNMDFTGTITSMPVSADPTFASGVTVLTTAYAGMINAPKPVTTTTPASWSSIQINLQSLSPIGTLETYTVTANAKGTATGQTDVIKSSGPQTFTVEAEGINFDVNINF